MNGLVTESQLSKAHMRVDDALESLSEHDQGATYHATEAICRAIQAAGYEIAHALGSSLKVRKD